MGKKWHNKKKKKNSGNKPGLGLPGKNRFEKPKKERPEGYEEFVRESKDFEAYYKAQNFIPEEEWETFIKVLKEDLPAAFRFTGSKNHANALLKLLKERFFSNCQSDISAVKPLKPFCLPWYPDNLGWQLNLTRKDIRRSEAYWKLHQFLITETETGNISRQEAVSMIPPLLLEVEASHKVLDMCAAPGSKTAQIIEFLHCNSDTSVPEGMVVANDSDNKRCYMLTHQAKRLQSPTLLITNHDAAFMPNVHYTRKDGSVGPMKFDRVLCDVPCSGDGTLRKNFDVWTKWNSVNGANLHGLQLRIARRGLEMLSVGGRLVYSTCSLNPLENEAVINRLLAEFSNSVRLVDAKEKLPGLKSVAGLEEWSVLNRELEVLSTPDEIPSKDSNYIHKHLFPPSLEERSIRNLQKCIRILPHHQDTGGFFVAVLEKFNVLPGEKVYVETTKEANDADSTNENATQRMKPPPKKRRCRGFREEPFYYMGKDNENWKNLSSFYGFHDNVDETLFLTRVKEGSGKNIYFTNSLVKDIVNCNENRLKIINTGVKVLVRSDNKGSDCDYRLAQEGSVVLLPLFTKRKLTVHRDDLITMLLNEDTELPPQIATMHESTQSQCNDLDCGSIAFVYEDSSSEAEYPLRINLVGWKGKMSLRCYVAKNERIHFLRLLGADTSIFEKNKFAELRDADAKNKVTNVTEVGNEVTVVGDESDVAATDKVEVLNKLTKAGNDATDDKNEVKETSNGRENGESLANSELLSEQGQRS